MIFIALGSNLPGSYRSCEAVIRAACVSMSFHGIDVVASSSVHVTAPVPASNDPLYRNSVVQVETKMNPADLMRTLKVIEGFFGVRDNIRNSPRVLDLDIIDYHGQIHNTGDLILPHPRMHERGFVLKPLSEIAPHWQHPVLQKSIFVLMAELKSYAHVHLSVSEGAAQA